MASGQISTPLHFTNLDPTTQPPPTEPLNLHQVSLHPTPTLSTSLRSTLLRKSTPARSIAHLIRDPSNVHTPPVKRMQHELMQNADAVELEDVKGVKEVVAGRVRRDREDRWPVKLDVWVAMD
ncbi:hypothetical protein HK097_006212 [Rhizophlyctis rosea]|uniref:Uncharacterized protein n=1 Tax=Rhizophlyctis rosea TaxID=64517 RepID=A0AAD5SFY3_9FUNG|nr:hypothetical protein HK097_006212 [Rhizophlyctis rosea]